MIKSPLGRSTLLACVLSTCLPALAANTIAVDPGYWAPVTVTGNGWFFETDETEQLPVKVSIIDPDTHAVVAAHQISASAARRNNRNMCFGGGTFTTQFSVPEVGADREQACASLQAVVVAVGMPAKSVTFWLPGCLN